MNYEQPIKIKPDAHILVVRRDNIGDLVCTTPMLQLLRQSYPAARIGVLVNVYNAAVLEGNPDVDEVFIYEKVKHVRGAWQKTKTFIAQTRLKAQLRRWQPDVAILAKAVYDRHGLKYLRSLKARCIIGYRDDAYPEQPDIALQPAAFGVQHEIDFLMQLLVPLGMALPPGPLRLFPQAEVVACVRQRIPMAPYRVAVHVSARDTERQWGLQNWSALIKDLLDKDQQLQIVLLWTPGKEVDPYIKGEDAMAAEVISTVDNPRLCALPVKRVPELIAAMSLCNGFVGADGGAVHIAAALKKPIVALFEKIPEKWRHWAPWQADALVIKSETDQVAAIPFESVAAAGRELVERVRHANKTT